MTTHSELLGRRAQAVACGVGTAFPIFAAKAAGAELWDIQGKRYIDFAGGIGVLNTGHRHPKVLEAVRVQLENFTHTAFQVVAYESYIELCERLNAVAPFSGAAKSILFSTGAECVENAIKIARAATRRPADSIERTLQALELLFRSDMTPSDVAAIIIEPVQGEGGFLVAPHDLLRELRRICDQHGILLIADEVQSGFARTGKFFGIEHSGVEPDLVAAAKSLAGGFPLSAVIGRAKLMDAVEPGGLGGTYAGNPVACAAALAVIHVIQHENLLERAEILGTRLKTHLASISAPIRSIRGPGAMVAFDLVTPSGAPDANAAKALTAAALEKGLILLTCGVHGNTIRALFPLTISDNLFNEALMILERCLRNGA